MWRFLTRKKDLKKKPGKKHMQTKMIVCIFDNELNAFLPNPRFPWLGF